MSSGARPIYLDYNATTPVDSEVLEAMRPYLEEHFGNPSSSHRYGAAAREGVERAREQAAGLLGCRPEEIVFTSGGTESNNLAVKGAAMAGRRRGSHVITSAVEHPAVAEVALWLEGAGFRVTFLPVDGEGLVDPGDVEKAIGPETVLVTIMHANNEVGSIQPIEEISRITRGAGVVFHTDAAQSVGKIPARVDDLGVDLLSVAGHKLYAPKGVGALYVREGTTIARFMHGASHERGMRAGTENVAGIVGLGRACEIAGRAMPGASLHMQGMRDRLFDGLRAELEGIRLNGHPVRRLPNTLSVGFLNADASELLLGMEGVAASAGAACHAGGAAGSSVLSAMKVPPGYAAGTVRFSTGRRTTAEEIDRAVSLVVAAVRRLRTGAGPA